MNDKLFTDELFKRMYNLGFNKAEIEDDVLFFFKNERSSLCPFSPRVMVACTCFEEKDQLIDIAEYLGVVDWSKVPIDTPILVRDRENNEWIKQHFCVYEHGEVFAWRDGKTSFSARSEVDAVCWNFAKLANEGGL